MRQVHERNPNRATILFPAANRTVGIRSKEGKPNFRPGTRELPAIGTMQGYCKAGNGIRKSGCNWDDGPLRFVSVRPHTVTLVKSWDPSPTNSRNVVTHCNDLRWRLF